MSIPFYVSPLPPGASEEDRKRHNAFLKEQFGGCTKEEPKPQEGDLRTELVFAWSPKVICEKRVWMRNYQRLYEYRVRPRRIYCLNVIGPVITIGGWDLIAERP